MLEKRFGFRKLGWLPLLMGVLLIGAFGASTAQAQLTWRTGDTTYIPLQHTMSSVGDSLKYKLGTITLSEGTAGNLKTTATDSVQIKAPANFSLVKDSVVTITASSVGGLLIDTTGFFATYGITQSSQTTVKLKALFGQPGNYISFMVKTASSGTVDTLTISGLYAQSEDTTSVKFDSTTTANIAFSQVGVGANTTSLSMLVALPGAASTIAFGPAGRYPNATQTAGNIINSASGGSTAPVDTSTTIVISFLDKKGNLTSYSSAAPTVIALLHSQTTLGNGTLGGTSTTHWYTSAAKPTQHTAIAFDGLTYTKAEVIDLKFTFGSSTLNTSTIVGAGLTFGSGSAANISVALQSGSSDTMLVGGSASYTLTVTDQYFNPVGSATPTASEATSHGGSFATISATDVGGHTTATFTASKFFVGADTLLFTSGTTASHAILINAGTLGGVIVDYAATSTGSAASGADVTTGIAAGTPIYVRAYLRDSYGNPISASDTSSVAFSISTATKTHGGVLTQSGKAIVSIPVAQASVTYSKPLQNAVNAISIPYAASDTSGNTDALTLTTKSGGYTASQNITIRSNVPVAIRNGVHQIVGTDSSVVVSVYVNKIVFQDTLVDTYGNLVVDPGTSVKIAPTHSSYGIVFTTNGLTKFNRGMRLSSVKTGQDTVTVDTLYTGTGLVSDTLSSYKVTGVDTLKTWATTSASVASKAPVWVTPAIYAKLAIAPHGDTLAVAGKQETFTVEKQDANGNHVDWGVAGNQTITQYKALYYTTGKLDTAKLNPAIRTDLSGLTADTVSTGHNRGGYVTHTYTSTGTASLASVGGSLKGQFPFTSYPSGADTQKVYVNLAGGTNDTVTVRSISTGVLKAFTASIAAGDSLHSAGDSVLVTFTAVDSVGNRIYTYGLAGQTLKLNHTAVSPIATKDTTFYFTYIRNHSGTVKAGDTLRTTGASITDTVFYQGQGKFWLRKFTVDSTNTVTMTGGGFTATPSQAVKWVPLTANQTAGTWTITIADTLAPTGAFTFTVYPRDKYDNLNSTEQEIFQISSNQTSGFNVGSNPKVMTGAGTFNGTLSSATGTLVIYLFSTSSPAGLYGQSKTVVLRTGAARIMGDVSGNGTVTAYDASLILRYVVSDTTLSSDALAAADVTGDGTVSALDASWILRKVAGDTTVHFASVTIKGQRFAPASLASSGTIALSGAEGGSAGLVSLPVAMSNARNVNAVELSLNIGQAISVQGVSGNLPKDWQIAYHAKDGVLKIAMAGVTPLSANTIATIQFKLADQSAKVNVAGTAKVNENTVQALGSVEVAALPTSFGLDQNYPNPFNPTTTIKYQLAKQTNVTLQIYSVTGQLVRTLSSGVQEPGYYSIEWNGLNNSGEQVSSGVYFYRLEAGSFVSFKKMLLLK